MKPKAALSLAFLVLLGLSSLSDATDAELSKSEHHHHHHDHQDHDQKVSISDDSDGGENGGDNGHHHHHHNQEEAGLNKGGEEHHHHHHHHDGDNKNGGEEHHHHHHHHDGDKKDGGEEHHHHHHHHDPDEVDSNKNGEHSSHHHHHHHHKDDDNEHHHHHQQHHHHDQNPKSCKPDIVPGSHTMQHGVDLNALDFFPMGEKSSDQANGILDAVFSFSCDPADPRTWKNPDEHRDRHGHHVHYSLPVDFQDVRPVPTGNKDFTVDISTSVHEVKESLELRASVSATFKGVGFSASGGYKTSKENMLKESKSVALTESHQSAYEIELKDRITLSEKFRHAVEKLPDDFGHHQSHYTEFIQQFGTHYFSVGRFGGSMVIRTEFDSSYVSSTSKHEIEQKIGVSVPLVAKGSISVSAGEQQVDQQFNSRSSSSLHYFGGSANLNSENALDEWHKSVAKNPWLFSGKLEPLDKAVGAHHSLKAKAEQIGKAIKVYLARASLVDLEETMTWKPEIKAKIEGDEASKKKLEKVKRFFDEETHHFHGKDIRKNIKRLTELLDVAHKG